MGVQCAQWCGKDWCLAQGCEMSLGTHNEPQIKDKRSVLRQVGPVIEPRLIPLIVQAMEVFCKTDFRGFIEEPKP